MTFRALIVLLSLTLSISLTYASTLDEKITTAITQSGEDIDIGIKAIDLKSGDIIFEKHATRYFNPASNFKLFTAFTALKFLGPNFHYQTQLRFNKKAIKKNTLNGNVVFHFAGDPLFNSKDLYQLLEQLSKKKIEQINGDIQLDVSAFDHDLYADGWAWDQLHICYSGPLSAANLNRNCERFYLKPDLKHDKAKIIPITNLQFMPITNEVELKDQLTCPLQMHEQDDNGYLLSGCLSPHSPALEFMAAITDPSQFVKKVIAAQLRSLSIKLNGDIIVTDHPDNLPVITTHSSKSSAELIKKMLKESDNLIANALLKTLGSQYYETQGTWANGMQAMKAILKKEADINPKEVFFADGSGESYYDRVTPEQISQLLVIAYHDSLLKKYFIPALPISRVDGTMIHRLDHMKGIVHAKTGSKRDANTLSGYIFPDDGQGIAFSIMTNGGTNEYKQYRDLEDEIVELLVDQST